jgi:hypothetical protein
VSQSGSPTVRERRTIREVREMVVETLEVEHKPLSCVRVALLPAPSHAEQVQVLSFADISDATKVSELKAQLHRALL